MIDRVGEGAPAIAREAADAPRQRARQVSVADDAEIRVPPALPLASLGDPGPHPLRSLAVAGAEQLVLREARDRQSEVDTVEQRARTASVDTGHADRPGTGTCFSGSPANPHGHGFAAATSVKRAGNSTEPPARVTTTRPSSSGWRSASTASRRNSVSSSRNSTPRCASETSPGRNDVLPLPRSPAVEMEWWGARKGRTVRSPRPSQQPGDRMELRRLERFVAGELGQDGGEAAGQHGLAGARASPP